MIRSPILRTALLGLVAVLGLRLLQAGLAAALASEVLAFHGERVGAVLASSLGFSLALTLAARAGRRPVRPPASLVRPLVVATVIVLGLTLMAAAVGFLLATQQAVTLGPPLADTVPRGRQPLVVAALAALAVGEAVGHLGGGLLVAVVWLSRPRASAWAGASTSTRRA